MDLRLLRLVSFLLALQVALHQDVPKPCPDKARRVDERCICDLGFISILANVNDPHDIRCEKCIKCEDKCQTSTLPCFNRTPYPRSSVQKCTTISADHFISHYSVVKCHVCHENEEPYQECTCIQNRFCRCKKGFYKDIFKRCKKRCSICTSLFHKKVHDCSMMPLNQQCADNSDVNPTFVTNFGKTTSTTQSTTTTPSARSTSSKISSQSIISISSTTTTEEIKTLTQKTQTKPTITLFWNNFGYGIFLSSITIAVIYFFWKWYRRPKTTGGETGGDTNISYSNLDDGTMRVNINLEVSPLLNSNPVSETAGGDLNQNKITQNEMDEMVKEIPKDLLDSIITKWLYTYGSDFNLHCKKEFKDRYINKVFVNEEARDLIIKTDNINNLTFYNVLEIVKAKFPKYTLKKAIDDWCSVGKQDVVYLLLKKIIESKSE